MERTLDIPIGVTQTSPNLLFTGLQLESTSPIPGIGTIFVSLDPANLTGTSLMTAMAVLTDAAQPRGPNPLINAELVTGSDDGSAADQAGNVHTGLDPLEVDLFPDLNEVASFDFISKRSRHR